jgi:hypothetical protein
MSATLKPQPVLVTALIQDFASAMAALLGADATVAPAAVPVDAAWAVSIAIGEPSSGRVTIGLAHDDCA